MLGWSDHRIENTRFWSLDRPLCLQVICKVPHRWQSENLMFVADGTSWIWQLLPIILQCAVHVVGWISNRILRWSRRSVHSPSVMRSEACCKFHEVHLKNLGNWYHCLSKWFFVFLDVLWNVVRQYVMLLLSRLCQSQCGQPLSQTDKNSNVALCYCFTTWHSQSKWDGSSIVDTSSE